MKRIAIAFVLAASLSGCTGLSGIFSMFADATFEEQLETFQTQLEAFRDVAEEVRAAERD